MRETSPQNPRIQVNVKQLDGTMVVSVSGHITELEADALGDTFDELFEQGNCDLILDLGDVAFLSSTGLGQIMRAYRMATERGGFIRIAQVQPLIADVFRVTKLDKLLGIYDTIGEALRAD